MARNRYDDLNDNSSDEFNPRRDFKKRHPDPKRRAKQQQHEIDSALSHDDAPNAPIAMTYKPSKFEGAWLMESLKPFFERSLITDVLELVRGGKEASVYVCAAHPALGVPYAAAKVYRPRMFRQIRDDSVYREGRETLSEEGRVVKKTSTLYWQGEITLIDFPQAGNPESNPNARMLFERDVARVCSYFADQGVEVDSSALAERIWNRNVRYGAHRRMADNLLLMQEE